MFDMNKTHDEMRNIAREGEKMASINYQITPHKFESAEKDHSLCRHCGLSGFATIHPIIPGQAIPLEEPSRKHQPFEYDVVEAPRHYCRHKYTTVQVIEDWGLDFFLGSALKYIERHDQKAGVEDLRKAKKYLEMKIELLETGKLEETIHHG